jgi:hypothetical protein
MSDVMTMRYLGVNHVNDMTNVDKSQEFLGDEPHKFLGDESHVTNIPTSRNIEKGL